MARAPRAAAAPPRRRRAAGCVVLLAGGGCGGKDTPAPTTHAPHTPHPPTPAPHTPTPLPGRWPASNGQCQYCPAGSGGHIPCCKANTSNRCNTYPFAEHLCCESCGGGSLVDCACDLKPCAVETDKKIKPEYAASLTGTIRESTNSHCCGRCGERMDCTLVEHNTTHCLFYNVTGPLSGMLEPALFSGWNVYQLLGVFPEPPPPPSPPPPSPPSPPSQDSGPKSWVPAVVVGAVALAIGGGVLVRVKFPGCCRGSSPPTIRSDTGHVYEILDQLGRGGYGVVFLVRRKGSSERFALKQIDCQSRLDAEVAKQEGRVLDRFNGHPQMVAIVERFFVDAPQDWTVTTAFLGAPRGDRAINQPPQQRGPYGSGNGGQPSPGSGNDDRVTRYYIVMDLWEEGDLNGLLLSLGDQTDGEALLGEPRLLAIVEQVCQLLHHLHNADPPIMHRDLKPQNILIADVGAQRPRIAVTDFGLARLQDASYMDTQAGSMPYIAPELWRKQYTYKVDMWSLGCLVYAMATLRVQRQGARGVRCLFAECRDEGFYEALRDEVQHAGYSGAVVDLMCALLREDPRARPTAEEVITRHLGGAVVPWEGSLRSSPAGTPPAARPAVSSPCPQDSETFMEPLVPGAR